MASELSTKCQSSTESSAEHAVILNSYSPTRNERLKACCKPTYHMRSLKNKGAIIVLITNFLSICLFYYIIGYGYGPYGSLTSTHGLYCLLTWSLTVPLVGWLADVILGRYGILIWSIWIMWMGMMLSTASSVVAQLIITYNNVIDKYISLVLLII